MSKNIENQNMFFNYVREFLFLHLKDHEYRSNNTITSYRQVLNSFREFTKAVYGKGVDKLTFEMVTSDSVREYLKWLVEKKECTINTRNHRLTVIKQYMQYCSDKEISLAPQYIVTKIHYSQKKRNGNKLMKRRLLNYMD